MHIKIIYLIIVLIAPFSCSNAHNFNREFIDEQKNDIDIQYKINNNQIDVSVKIDCIKLDSIIYSIPECVPGKYGKTQNIHHIINFNAFDSLGNKLMFNQFDRIFIIYDAKKLKELRYTVSSDKFSSKNILDEAIYIDSTLIVINNQILTGYFQDSRTLGINITIIKPKLYSVISTQEFKKINDTLDCYHFEDYQTLVDMPIIYSTITDTAKINFQNIDITISTYSPLKLINSEKIKELITPTVKAAFNEVKHFNLGKNYNFVFIFNDKVRKDVFDAAALEHKQSSVYVFFNEPDLKNPKDSTDFVQKLSQFVSHEILHLFAPISFRDSLRADFQYNQPIMSGHLWLYEGFIEYQSLKIRVQNKIITKTEFFAEIAKKINAYSRYEKMKYYFSLYDVSENIFQKENLFTSFYSRGAVLAFLMDIKVIEATKGEIDLFYILQEFYNKSSVFHQDSLIPYLEQKVPVLKPFFKDYIIGDKYPKLADFLILAGFEYKNIYKEPQYYYPIRKVEDGQDPLKPLIFFKEKTGGFNNDTLFLLSIEGKAVNSFVFSQIYQKYFETPVKTQITFEVDGKILTQDIHAIKSDVPSVPYFPIIYEKNNVSLSQKIIQKKLFEK